QRGLESLHGGVDEVLRFLGGAERELHRQDLLLIPERLENQEAFLEVLARASRIAPVEVEPTEAKQGAAARCGIRSRAIEASRERFERSVDLALPVEDAPDFLEEP